MQRDVPEFPVLSLTSLLDVDRFERPEKLDWIIETGNWKTKAFQLSQNAG